MTTPECPKGPERGARPEEQQVSWTTYLRTCDALDQARTSAATWQLRAEQAEPEVERLTAEVERLQVELGTIRGELADFAQESVPSHVSTLQAVRWLIAEHDEQLAAQPTLPTDAADQFASLVRTYGSEMADPVSDFADNCVALVQSWGVSSSEVEAPQRDGFVPACPACVRSEQHTVDQLQWFHRDGLELLAEAAQEARSATSEASPLVHNVILSSEEGAFGHWHVTCSCRESSEGDLAHAEFWKDQHLADTLVPVKSSNHQANQHDEGRPSGSTATPRSDEELLRRLRTLVTDLQNPGSGTKGEAYDSGFQDGLIQAGNDLEALLDEFAPDAAQAAGSGATREEWKDGDRAFRNGHIGWIARVGSENTPWVFQYADGAFEDFTDPSSLTKSSPSLRKEGEDSD